jgi:hypothetical protein
MRSPGNRENPETKRMSRIADLRGKYLVDTLHDYIFDIGPEGTIIRNVAYDLTASQIRADQAWQD